jgi:hypothetical protein
MRCNECGSSMRRDIDGWWCPYCGTTYYEEIDIKWYLKEDIISEENDDDTDDIELLEIRM